MRDWRNAVAGLPPLTAAPDCLISGLAEAQLSRAPSPPPPLSSPLSHLSPTARLGMPGQRELPPRPSQMTSSFSQRGMDRWRSPSSRPGRMSSLTALRVQLPSQPSPPAGGAAPGGSALLPGAGRGGGRDGIVPLSCAWRSASCSPRWQLCDALTCACSSSLSPEGVQTHPHLCFSPPPDAAPQELDSAASKMSSALSASRSLSSAPQAAPTRSLAALCSSTTRHLHPPSLSLFTGSMGAGMPRHTAAPGGDRR